MTDEEPIQEPGEAEGRIELDPEERERLAAAAEHLRQTLRQIDFKFPQIERLNQLVAGVIEPPRLTLPESVLWTTSAMSSFASQQSKPLDTFKPLLSAQEALKKQITAINSDIFKGAASTLSNMGIITAHLTTNVDFGLSNGFAKLAQQVATQHSTWLKTLGPTLESLKRNYYPPNLRQIDGLRWEDVESVVMVDGIALYGVPRSSIAEALIRADSAAERRDILGLRWKAISADCRAAIERCESAATASYIPMAQAALDAFDAGHSAAAQALTGALLDAMVNTYFGRDRHLYTPDKHGKRTNAAYDEFSANEYIALAPIWQAWQKFFPDEGLPIPRTFSRNATAHTVSAKQYTKRNAVQSLMIASSLIYFFDREAARVNTA